MSKRPFVAVIGDVMLDRHVTCEVVGISPEDETALKIRPISVEMKAGGAANVANNLMSLGARVLLAGYTGQDVEADLLSDQITESLYSEIVLLRRADRVTTLKSRYLTGRGRHIVRVDQETIKAIPPASVTHLMSVITERFKPDRVVVSDYAKGVVTPFLMEQLARHVDPDTIIVDPKGTDFTRYGKVGIVTPNLGEFQGVGGDEGSRAVRLLCSSSRVVVTRGNLGCRTFQLTVEPDRLVESSTHLYCKDKDFSVRARDVGDPTGCGDSFLAGLAYKLAQGDHLDEACKFANACGACSYDHAGAHVVTEEEVVMEMKKGAVHEV
jgi:D-beta-D-heptose 7-phosphate kinase/D-beta-D-heptose 1-phosphate adenosyltransferase